MSACTGTQVFGEIAVDEGAGARVDGGLLEQGRAHAEGHAAGDLGARHLGVQDAARREDTQHPPEPDLGRINVDAHFGKLGAVAGDRLVLVVRLLPHAGDLALRLHILERLEA
jgi:hypothetical protein